MPRLVFLGTGSVVSLERASAGIGIEYAPDAWLLLDTCGGNELLRQLRRAHIDPAGITHIFLSHQHYDHVAGLPLLLLVLCRSDGPVTLCTPPEAQLGVRWVIDTMCPGVFERLGTRLTWELPQPGQTFDLAPGAQLTPFPVEHVVEAMGCRIALDGFDIVYSGDTAPHDGFALWAAGADLLIHEATGLERERADVHANGHSTAADAARTAAAAGVRRLVLTHVGNAGHARVTALLEEAGRYYTGPISVAEDLETIEVAAGGTDQ
jgi:ribonuclease Z